MIKIANSAEDPAVIDLQMKALQYIAAVDPELAVPRVLLSRDGHTIEQIQAPDGRVHFMRVLTYLQGCHPQVNPTDHALLHPIGAAVARIELALRGFFHPAADHELLWDSQSTPPGSKLIYPISTMQNSTHWPAISWTASTGMYSL